jgi:hypothetical protein
VPHPCAFFAQGWDSTEASRMGFMLHMVLGGAALQRCGNCPAKELMKFLHISNDCDRPDQPPFIPSLQVES